MSTPAVEIPIRADTSQAKRAISELSAEIVGRLTPVVDVGELATKAFGALTSAVSSAVGWLRDAAAAAADAEKTQRLLAAAVGDHYDALATFNGALSAKLGMDDDDLAAMQTKLVGLGVQQSKLEEATKATLGLAAATGKDLMAATKQVSAAFVEGGAEAKRLASLYVFAEEEAATFEGRTRALNTAWGDLIETLGGAVVSSQGVTQTFGALTEGVREFTGFLNSTDGKAMVDSFFVSIAHGAAGALDGLVGMVKMADDIKRKIDDILGRVTTEPIVEGGGFLGTIENLADRLRGVKGGQVAGGSVGGGALGSRAKTGGRALAAGGASSAMSPEQAMGAQGRTTEFDAEVERQQMERDRLALDVQRQQIEREQALRDEQRDRRARDFAMEEEQTQQHYAQLATIGLGGVTGFLSGTIQAWVSGRASLDEAAAMAFGGMLSQIGQGLFAMGSAAVAAGLLGSVAPIFAPATGGPLGITAGLGLMAAGGVLMGLGGLASAAATPSAAGSSATTATLPRGRMDGAPLGFRGEQSGPQTTVINVNFGAGLVTGTPREIGRTIADMLRQADSLRPGWQR